VDDGGGEGGVEGEVRFNSAQKCDVRWASCVRISSIVVIFMARGKERQQAHDLIERLAPSQISAVVHLLEVMTDPVTRSLANAPVDDEPVTEEEAREIAAARASLDRGEDISHEKVLAEFGLTSKDFARMGRTPLDPDKPSR
jgi:hypothetical protein